MSLEEIIEIQYWTLFEKNLKREEDLSIDLRKEQRCKFRFISYLISKLFEYKNSKEAFISVSNLIILSLSGFEEEYPIDLYSVNNDVYEDEFSSECMDILRQEFNSLN